MYIRLYSVVYLEQLVQLLLKLLGMFVNLRLFQVEGEAVPEHLPQVSYKVSNTAVLVGVLLVKPLFDDVQGDGVLDLVQVGGEVQVAAVSEWDGLRPHVVHLKQQPSAGLQISVRELAMTLLYLA